MASLDPGFRALPQHRDRTRCRMILADNGIEVDPLRQITDVEDLCVFS